MYFFQLFLQPIDFRLTHNGGSGLSIVSLPQPIEARYIRVLIMDYVGAPCIRVELMGCTRQDCAGMLHYIYSVIIFLSVLISYLSCNKLFSIT